MAKKRTPKEEKKKREKKKVEDEIEEIEEDLSDCGLPDETLEKIKGFRLLDDLYMREVLKANRLGVQDIIRVILEREDLVVRKMRTQEVITSTRGRSVQLDVLAEDSKGRFYNIEIQRDKRGATPKRARFHLAAIDSRNLKKGDDFEELAETWVIFITEDGALTGGRPYVTARRFVVETQEPFNDEQFIRFVNASYVSDDPFGWLMADLRETDPRKMHFDSLRKRSIRCKRTRKGIMRMGGVIEEIFQKGKEKGHAEGREEERVRTIGVLLSVHSPDVLLNDPQFSPLGYTQAEIDAAIALGGAQTPIVPAQ